jgi:hypothetical protein
MADTVTPEVRTELAGLNARENDARAGITQLAGEGVQREQARQTALAPAQAAYDATTALPGPRRESEAPPPVLDQSKLKIDPKEYEGLSYALIGMALIGGATSHGNWLGASAALNGALKGFQEGNKEVAQREYDRFKQATESAAVHERQADKRYEDALKDRNLTLNQQLARIKTIAAEFDHKDVLAAAQSKSFEAVISQVESRRTQLLNTLADVNKVTIHVDAQREAAATKAAAAGGGDAALQPDELKFMAGQYLAGDKSVLQNLGRGAQGSKNIVALRREVMTQAQQQGMSPADVAVRIAEFGGLQAGERTLGTRTAQTGMAVNEAQKFGQLVRKASANVPRSKFPAWNSAQLAWEKGTGGENVVAFSAALNSYINAYARAVSPLGNGTISDKEHARETIEAKFSDGQINAALDQLDFEMQAAKASPAATKQDLRDLAHGGAPAGGNDIASQAAAELARRQREGK